MRYDLIIIGAGPGGLTAGIYARTRMMKTLILDAAEIGGQLVSLYPDKAVQNYPGYERIQARKLSDKMYAQAESMDCEIRDREKVNEIRGGNDELVVITDKGQYHTSSVIVATGMGMFKPKKMGCKGEEEFENKGLCYILPPKEDLIGKRVVVFGGGNSAIEMALIADSVAETTIVHRRNEFRCDESNTMALNASNIRSIMSSELVSVNGDDAVRSVTLKKGDETFDVEADLVVILIGISADLEDLKRWDLELTKDGLLKVDDAMCTSRNGIFACGDVIDYDGKYKQIITACGEAATASNSAYKFVKKPYWA
ncbi:MAG: NAD(P)/FAD-dependent oxidoreductase [Methanomassiliicoccaceae archaeon]|jgi:thioredoxin reductase (NADPH)|nr:NAD(P)/FAD-dependent oxidoreductase [Methanomassiliicoccaceae archaeon]